MIRPLLGALLLAALCAGPAPAQLRSAAPLPLPVFEERSLALTRQLKQALDAGDLQGAESGMLDLVALTSDQFGPAAPDTLMMMRAFAGLLEKSGGSSIGLRRLAYERSLAAHGPLDPATLGALDWLTLQLLAAGDPEAADLAKRSVAANRRIHGPDARETRSAEINLAAALLNAGDTPAAIVLLEDLAARFATAATDEDRAGRVLVLMQLANARFTAGAHAEALAAADQAAAVLQGMPGRDDQTLGALDILRSASLLSFERFAEGEAVLREALDRMARTKDEDPDLARTLLFNLAQVLGKQGRQDEARAVAGDALLAVLGARFADPAAQLAILRESAEMLQTLGLPDFQIEALRARLDLTTAVFGPDAPETYTAMSELGDVLALTGRMEEARPLLETAFAGLGRLLGPEDPATLRAAQRAAAVWSIEGRMAEVVDAQERYLRHLRLTIGPEAENTLIEEGNLVAFLYAAGRYAEARQRAQETLARMPDTPGKRDRRHALNRVLAMILIDEGDPASALALLKAERSHAINAFRMADVDVAELGALSPRDDVAQLGRLLGQAAWLAAAQSGAQSAAQSGDAARQSRLRDGAFEDAQLAAESDVSAAVSRAAARETARDPQLRQLFADWERLQDENARRRIDRADRLSGRAGGGPLEARYDAVQAFAALQAALRRDHPELMGLLTPPAVPLARLQGADGGRPLLREDEALVLVMGSGTGSLDPEDLAPGMMQSDPGPDFGLVWAVSRDAAAWAVLPLRNRDLLKSVARLRGQLDPQDMFAAAILETFGETAPASSFDLAARAPVQPSGLAAGGGAGAPRPFDIEAAHDLHQAIFGDPGIAAVLGDKPIWIVVGQGEALATPFNALVARRPAPGTEGAARLRETGWLGIERALLTQPSVAAFAALRAREAGAAEKAGPLGYVAFGDPVFGARPPLARLAGTRAEIAEIAGLKGIEPLGVEFAADASEARLADLAASGRLQAADILHFATHGVLIRNSEEDLRPEAALALTPPAGPARLGAAGLVADGFLRTSEIAALRLSADWVILSACNTAGRLGFGGSGSQGLAEGFLQAGARNVLVSHWRVQDDVAARLVVDTVAGSLAGLPKAEALRRAMGAVAADTSRDGTELPNAHPSVWAPFLLVGGGEAERLQEGLLGGR